MTEQNETLKSAPRQTSILTEGLGRKAKLIRDEFDGEVIKAGTMVKLIKRVNGNGTPAWKGNTEINGEDVSVLVWEDNLEFINET